MLSTTVYMFSLSIILSHALFYILIIYKFIFSLKEMVYCMHAYMHLIDLVMIVRCDFWQYVFRDFDLY